MDYWNLLDHSTGTEWKPWIVTMLRPYNHSYRLDKMMAFHDPSIPSYISSTRRIPDCSTIKNDSTSSTIKNIFWLLIDQFCVSSVENTCQAISYEAWIRLEKWNREMERKSSHLVNAAKLITYQWNLLFFLMS